jgi:hypothetical protein
MPGNRKWCQSVYEEQANPSSSFAGGHRLGRLLASLQAVSARGRIVCWLLMFISTYRLGLPVLFAAALSGLPWLLLKSPPAARR